MKNDKVVIYKTKYGSTKKYAGWIALKIGADLYEVSDISVRDLDRYNSIIYGGGLYVGRINGFKFIEKNYEKIKDKNLIVFTVGMQSMTDELEALINSRNFAGINMDKTKVLNFKGSFDYSILTLKDKVMMRGLKESISKKMRFDLNEDEKIILDGFEKEVDLCDKKSIELLIETVEGAL